MNFIHLESPRVVVSGTCKVCSKRVISWHSLSTFSELSPTELSTKVQELLNEEHKKDKCPLE